MLHCGRPYQREAVSLEAGAMITGGHGLAEDPQNIVVKLP